MPTKNLYQGNYVYNRKPVITTAPDAFLFINGQRTIPICKTCNSVFDPDQFVTSISTSLSVDAPGSGNCALTLNVPRNSATQLMNNGIFVIQPMMELEVYLKGYFLVNGQPQYYPAFWGIVSTIDESFQGGFHTFSIQCKDMLYWWGLTKFGFSPSLYGAHQDEGNKITAFATTFKQMNVFQIIVALAVMSMDASLMPSGTSVKTSFGIGNSDDAVGENALPKIGLGTRNMMQYWAARNNQIARALRIFGANGSIIYNGAQFPTCPTTDDQFKELQQFKPQQLTINGASLEVDEKTTTQYSSFNKIADSIPLFDTDGNFQSKLEIAVQVRDFIGWEFYLDTTGEIIFKPPFYNIDVKPNFPVSWIRDIEVLDWNFQEAEPEATRVEVTGSYTDLQTDIPAEVAVQGIAVDYNLVRQFGVRPQHIDRGWIRTSQGAYVAALNELDRITARRFDGSVTIIGRPELRLGFPVYIESRDAYYYVADIQHNFNYGGAFTTTLSLIGRRTRYQDPYFIPLSAVSNGITPPLNIDKNGVNRATTNGNGFVVGQNIGIPNAVLRLSNDKDEIKKYLDKQAALLSTGAPISQNGQPPTPVQTTLAASGYINNLATPTPLEYQRSLDQVQNGFIFFAPQGIYVPDIDKGQNVTGVYIFFQKQNLSSTTTPSTVLNGLLSSSTGAKITGDFAIFPVSDSVGYELIGLFPYGRGLSIQISGAISVPTAALAANLNSLTPGSIAAVNQAGSTTARAVTSGGATTSAVFKVDQTQYGLVFADMQPANSNAVTTICACKLSNQDIANMSFLQTASNGQLLTQGLSWEFSDASFAELIGLNPTQIQTQLSLEMKYQSDPSAPLSPSVVDATGA